MFEVKEIEKLIERSYFVIPQRVKLWKLAINEWLRYKGCSSLMSGEAQQEVYPEGSEEAKEDAEGIKRRRDWHHFKSLVLVLPLLEHALRRLYVVANGLSEANILTAGVFLCSLLDAIVC